MGKLICLFGADGSGKTSIARHASAYLGSRRQRTRIAWMRGSHTLASVLARLLSRFRAFRGPCNPYYHVCVPPGMRLLWLLIELASALPVLLLRFAVPKLLGYTVIAERSPIDLLVWLAITLRWGGVAGNIVGGSIAALQLSLCDRTIYIRAGLDVLLARRGDLAERRLVPAQLRVYDAIARVLRAPCIDTSEKTVSESVGEVLEVVSAGEGRGQ